MNDMIYMDNAATSWPKPECVQDAVLHYLRDVGANPGRSGHRLANEGERIRFGAREAIAELVGMRDPTRVVFALNGTTAINLAIAGLLAPGDHAVATGMEHNAVMRPLRAAEQRGVSIGLASCRPDGSMDAAAVEALLEENTRLIVANHASNVCGTVLPIREIGELARERGIPLLVDAAQTLGCWPLDLESDRIDLLAFSGHKGLLGPGGTGGLVLGEGFDHSVLPPLIRGGTGSWSEREEQPDFLPDRYEAGTPNGPGLAGLGAAVRYVQERGVEVIRERERGLTQRLIDGLLAIPGARVQGTLQAQRQTAVVSFTLEGRSASEIAFALDEEHGVLCRPGLHCAPRAHRTLGTAPEGTARLSPGPFTAEEEVDAAVAAVRALAESP